MEAIKNWTHEVNLDTDITILSTVCNVPQVMPMGQHHA